eukprot:CAMPEP_0170548304 /NCGR_PEP_ID=MMETSP0211-20121228/6635_1 /TAXON_ID=311385 /ORGANISM="Pseudokeronopsis sp., Strain OXSARD2" /LENGTH=57 /DNA_ID=CAMNT_0010853785 /DNA_START=730 /DNA_END=903 /DNA_ORIENTATION=-
MEKEIGSSTFPIVVLKKISLMTKLNVRSTIMKMVNPDINEAMKSLNSKECFWLLATI